MHIHVSMVVLGILCKCGEREKNAARALTGDGKKKIKRRMEKRTANMEWPLVGHDSLSAATF